MKTRSTYSVLLILGLLMQCGKAPQDSPSAMRGVDDDEIRIGSWAPQTGPAALWGAVARGMDCYFQLVNEEEGGIHGRKIKFIHRDDGYQPPRTRAVVKEMVERDEVFGFAGGVGTAPGMAVRDYLIKNKIPWVAPSSGSSHWAWPKAENIFSIYPLYYDEAALLVDYAVNELGKTRFGFVYQNDDYGKSGLTGANLALEGHGLEHAVAVSTEIMDTDLSAQVLKLREAGVEVVIIWLLPKQAQILVSSSAKLDFKPQWMTSSALSDQQLMMELTNGAWKGTIYSSFANFWDLENPRMARYHKAWQKYASHEKWGPFFISGFMYAEPIAEGLRRCGPEITYEKFIEAMESFDNFQGLGPPLTFGPDIRQGRRSSRLFRCDGPTDAIKLVDLITANIDVDEAIRRMNQ